MNRAEDLPDPNDPASMERFLAATAAFLEATAADGQMFSKWPEEQREKDATLESTAISAIRSQPVLRLPAQLETFRQDPEAPDRYTGEEEDTISRATKLCELIAILAESVPKSWAEGIREIIGETLQGIDNPEQQAAWLNVLREVCRPYRDVDEILGPDPELTVLQLVAQQEQKMEKAAAREAQNLQRQQFASQIIDVFVGPQEHDDMPSLKETLLILSTLPLSNFGEQLHARSLLEKLEEMAGRRPNISKEIFLASLTGIVNGIRTKLELPTLGKALPPLKENE